MSLSEPADYSTAFVGAPDAIRAAKSEPNVDGDFATDAGAESTVDAPSGSRAVIYLRVSSKGQVNTDYDPEGISIPAQRVAVTRKAEQLGLTIVAEYVEPGQSGTEMTKRIAFQQMLERIRRKKDIDYVIVHKLSRFARNRIDDAVVMADLQKRGVVLISATESIDETPVGQLMHGILSAFNEYRSREDGADIAYKMGQKAKNGGTLGRAPIGYLNVTDTSEGRRINTVEVDPERAPFVKIAFELYASGNHTFQDIADELTDRGLTTRPTLRRPAGPISDSKIQQMLRSRYYLGEVGYKDEWYPGRHEPLITDALFNAVERLMDSRGYASERRRKHDHYLKGTVWCARCRLEERINRRLILLNATSRQGVKYPYFICRGTQDHTCDIPYSTVDRVEDAVAEHYRTVTLDPRFVAAVRTVMQGALDDQVAARRLLRKQVDNLIDLAADGGLDTGKVRIKLREITRNRTNLTNELATLDGDLKPGLDLIDAYLRLLENAYELYQFANDEVRRELNQAIFEHIYVGVDEVTGDEIKHPLRELLAAQSGWSALRDGASLEQARERAHLEASKHEGTKKETVPENDLLDLLLASIETTDPQRVGDSSKPLMVPLEGLEPPTVSLGRRSGGKEPICP
jgi:site-specific DNA recombinase